VNGLVDVNMVLSPPIRGGDLEANQKARTFGAMPNKVSLLCVLRINYVHVCCGVLMRMKHENSYIGSHSMSGNQYIIIGSHSMSGNQ
jgi:hypothetical protein